MALLNKLSFFHKYLIYTIIFINGYKLILPIDISDDSAGISISLPLWATNFEIHGIYLSDFLFICYFSIFGIKYFNFIFNGKYSLIFFYLILSLSLIGILSTIINFEIFTDYFEAMRLATLALFFICMVWWTDLLGEINVLRIFLIGLIVSGTINLYFTFSFSLRLLGGLPQLLGQNGPGGSAGFLAFIGAWFFIITEKLRDKIISIVFILLFIFILIISYSKLGMLMGFCGVMCFVTAIFITSSLKIIRNRIIIVLCFLSSFIVWLTNSVKGQILIEGASTFYYYKLGTEGAGIVEKEGGDEERLYYYFAVGEVFLKNPIFGVSYNGFGAAVSKTKAYSTGRMSDEDSFVNANPHNAFLYYISANGILGWIITVIIFLTFLFVFYMIFMPFGVSGVIIFCAILFASLIHTNTLIGFFNTTIMYFPTAIAVSILQRRTIFKQIK